MQPYLSALSQWTIKTGIPVLFIVITSLILLKIIDVIIDKYFNNLIKAKNDAEFEKRANTLNLILKSMANIVILAVGFTIILAKLGIEIGPILATAGVLGISVGFGAKQLIENIISGFIILVEDQIRVGDVVQIAGKEGVVEKIDLKMVVLRDISGNVHYINNGKIDIVTNMTRDYSFYVFDIGVSYRENVDKVIDVIKRVDEELRQDENFKHNILEPIEIFGLDKFDDSAVIIKARTKTRPIKQWAVGREFNRRLKLKFDELNIEIPFPQRTVYMRTENEHAASI
ncbi:MAG: mechanosensitive ion channel protein MscS [Candidatus Melainabacteria bacterium GWF2_37_15]|nr:MAG: mechanosensitive ion channel protein MscS [Candidatus Melainabacteria bacterium GWF2_37_15]